MLGQGATVNFPSQRVLPQVIMRPAPSLTSSHIKHEPTGHIASNTNSFTRTNAAGLSFTDAVSTDQMQQQVQQGGELTDHMQAQREKREVLLARKGMQLHAEAVIKVHYVVI